MSERSYSYNYKTFRIDVHPKALKPVKVFANSCFLPRSVLHETTSIDEAIRFIDKGGRAKDGRQPRVR